MPVPPSRPNLGGYSLISAESIDEAVELARNCPFLRLGGGVEVGELTPPRSSPVR
jgi:hypothetical protein